MYNDQPTQLSAEVEVFNPKIWSEYSQTLPHLHVQLCICALYSI